MVDPDTDPLANVIALLKPQPAISKVVEAGGSWQVERSNMASPFYAAIVEGGACLTVAGRRPAALKAGDFVLIPNLDSFTMSSEVSQPTGANRTPVETDAGKFRLGASTAPVEMRALVGHCRFAAPDRALLLSLLPEMIHVSGQDRLMALVSIIHEETRSDRPARVMVLQRLLEVLMIEALRSSTGPEHPPGLLRGLSDPRLAGALSRIHQDTSGSLSVAELARDAGMSRSAFFDRFRRALGSTPMDYVTAWRMAVARDLLIRGGLTNGEIAHRVGYGSASAFGLAFLRHEGMAPGEFAEKHVVKPF